VTDKAGRAPGKATSFDIAYQAGVSQPTVSRALRGSPRVSEETRKRVLAVAHQLNYKVDKNASNLRFQRSSTLALLIFEDPTSDDSAINPFFVSMLGSITRASAQRGYDLLVSFQQQADDWHEEYEDTRKADGLILLGYGDYLLYRERLERLTEQGIDVVRVSYPDMIGVDRGRDVLLDMLPAAAEHGLAFCRAVYHTSPMGDVVPAPGGLEAGLPDINHDGTIMVKSGLSARPEMGPMPAMFVAAGQAGYMTTASGKDAVVAVYALNGTYPTVAEGLDKDLPDTEKVLNQMRRFS